MPIKPKHNYKALPNEIQHRDLFQTPRYATELLIPYIPEYITHIWEPAAGKGKIVNVLQAHGYNLEGASDINGEFLYWNFLSAELLPLDANEAIITNPPFSLKKKFFERCLEYEVPFALLIPADFSFWNIDAVRKYGCRKLIPDHRIDYITPLNKKSSAQFHSMWLCSKEFNLPEIETFVELTKEMKENI